MTTDITELAQSHELRNKVNHRLYGALEFQGTSGENATIALSIDECKSIIAAMDERIALVEALEKAQRYIEELREWNAGLAQESFERQQCIIELQQRHEVDPRTHEIIDLQERIIETNDVLCNLLPDCRYMDPPDGGSVTPLEQVSRMVADYRQRIAELESRTVKLPDDAEHDIMAPVAAYLSEKFKWDGSAVRWDGRNEYDVLADRVKYALRMVIRRAAGIKMEVE